MTAIENKKGMLCYVLFILYTASKKKKSCVADSSVKVDIETDLFTVCEGFITLQEVARLQLVMRFNKDIPVT